MSEEQNNFAGDERVNLSDSQFKRILLEIFQKIILVAPPTLAAIATYHYYHMQYVEQTLETSTEDKAVELIMAFFIITFAFYSTFFLTSLFAMDGIDKWKNRSTEPKRARTGPSPEELRIANQKYEEHFEKTSESFRRWLENNQGE